MNLEVLKERWSNLSDDIYKASERRAVDRSTLTLMCQIIEENKYKRILEIGTFLGRTACHMAATCAPFGGSVTTINVNRIEYNKAKEMALELGLDNINFMLGDSLNVIPELDGPWDFVFIDGHHSYTYAMGEYNLVKDKMNPVSTIIFDDACKVHPNGKRDGGVPRAVEESGAKLITLGKTIVGLINHGSVNLPTEEGD